MMKVVWFFCISLTLFANPTSLQFQEISTWHKHTNETEKVLISREKKECIDVHANPETVYGGDIVKEDIPSVCKKSVVTTVGKIQPMNIASGVITVGELEVLEFIKNKLHKDPQRYILVDARRIDWYEILTIPGATHLSYDEMIYDEDFKEDWERFLDVLNIKYDGKNFDFSSAKTMVIFCNASWCVQSPTAIKTLLSYGYPPQKILWYRGGLQSWILSGFNTIKPK